MWARRILGTRSKTVSVCRKLEFDIRLMVGPLHLASRVLEAHVVVPKKELPLYFFE